MKNNLISEILKCIVKFNLLTRDINNTRQAAQPFNFYSTLTDEDTVFFLYIPRTK